MFSICQINKKAKMIKNLSFIKYLHINICQN